MKISTKGTYALRLMMDIASHSVEGSYVSLNDVAGRQSISKKYLEQIVPKLSKAGLVKAGKGHTGGYTLAKKAAKITMKDIITAAEGKLTADIYKDKTVKKGPENNEATTLPIYEGMYEMLNQYMDAITLEDLV